MAHDLNIRIDNIPLSDNVAKIISLSLRGLSYEEISKVSTFSKGYIRNEVSRYYSLLGIPPCINALNFVALHHGFDFNGRAGKVPLLCDYEQHRLQKHVPRLAKYQQLQLQFGPY